MTADPHSSSAGPSQGDVTESSDGPIDGSNGIKDEAQSEKTIEDLQQSGKERIPNLRWSSNTSLYCSFTGRSHADLWEFGLDNCPRCDQDLSKPVNFEAPARPLSPKPVAQKTHSKTILHAVEYRDNGNNTIGSEPWDDEIDLESMGLANSPAFEIVTVLLTSIQANSNRQDWESERLVASGILEKPHIRAKIVSKRLTVHSAPLLRLLRGYISYYPSATLDASALWLEEPFALVAHHYKELQKHWDTNKHMVPKKGPDGKIKIEDTEQEEDEEVTGLRHLGWLLDFFKKAVLDDMVKEEARHARDMCTFRMLWLLFKPGMTVYHESDGHLSAYVLQSVDTDDGILSIAAPLRPKPYKIKVWSLEFDGKYVGRVGKSIIIAPFEGERPIRSLQLVPCNIIDRDDGGKWKQELEENGKKWYQLLPGGQIHYSGPVLGETKRQVCKLPIVLFILLI